MSAMREKIVQAAIALFAAHGYAGTSTRAICEAAGITKPVLYYYFRSKQQLYRELVAEIFGYYRKILVRAAEGRGNLRTRLARIIAAGFDAARQDPARVAFLLRMIFAREENIPVFDYVREFDEQRAVIARVIREGTVGRLRAHADRLAAIAMGMEFFAILEHFHTGCAALTRRNAAVLAAVFVDGCMERPAGLQAKRERSRER